jgi:hypothetical protein
MRTGGRQGNRDATSRTRVPGDRSPPTQQSISTVIQVFPSHAMTCTFSPPAVPSGRQSVFASTVLDADRDMSDLGGCAIEEIV